MSDPGINEIDTDGDGINDAVSFDGNNDGFAEEVTLLGSDGTTTVVADTDGDQVYDHLAADTDGDGSFDSTEIDSDGDGLTDIATYDPEGDGIANTTDIDTDGDGTLETHVSDLDDDGNPDAIDSDTDGDGISDLIVTPGETLTLDPSGHVIDIEPTDTGSGIDDSGGYAEDPGYIDDSGGIGDPSSVIPDGQPGGPSVIDPSASDPSSVIPGDPGSGDPADVGLLDPSGTHDENPDLADAGAGDDDSGERERDAADWFAQTGGTCAPSTVAMIVSEYSGGDININEDEFANRAEEMGLAVPGADGEFPGLSVEATAALLQSYGVPSHMETGSVDSLDSYLDNGYNAIVSVDSAAIWHDKVDTGANDHVVVVSSIENGMVYLNDSGNPDGGELEPVPVDVFEQAWATGGHQMIVTDVPDSNDGPVVDGAGAPVEAPAGSTDAVQAQFAAPDESFTPTIILPFVIAGQAVEDWLAEH